MNQIQAIRYFASIALGTPVTIARKRDCWSMGLLGSYPRLYLPEDLNENDEEDKMFRKNFISRYPTAQGFANITLAILHELGHWVTRNSVNWLEYAILASQVSSEEYFDLEAERIATDWAIEWLSQSQNRKLAKSFEVQYFGH